MKRFKPIFVEGTDLGDTWFQLLWNLNKFGRRSHIDSGSYQGTEKISCDFASGFIHHPHTTPLAPQMPEGSDLPPPTDDEHIHQYFTEYLMNGTIKSTEHYRYSSWIVGDNVNCFVNQLQWVINHFKRVGLGNEHCYITIGDASSNLVYDQTYLTPTERKTSPCLRGLDFRVIEDTVCLHVIYRSWDLWAGWPVNMGGFTLLNEFVAQELSLLPGPLSFSCKSIHCYDFQFDFLNKRICEYST